MPAQDEEPPEYFGECQATDGEQGSDQQVWEFDAVEDTPELLFIQGYHQEDKYPQADEFEDPKDRVLINVLEFVPHKILTIQSEAYSNWRDFRIRNLYFYL